MSKTIVITIFLLGNISCSIFAQNWNQVVKAVASDRATNDRFGYSVSISGDYAIVGAHMEDHNATGGQYLDNCGAAYILKNNSGTWTVVQKIVASDRAADDEFGTSVAISGDYAIVGAPRKTIKVGFDMNSYAGAAYIFKNTSGTWSQLNKLVSKEPNFADEFGYSVAISNDYAIVGTPYDDVTQSNQGSAQIYKRDTTKWWFEQTITGGSAGNGDLFGWSVGISGNYVIVGEPHDGSTAPVNYEKAGAAYIFIRGSSGTWNQTAKLNASDKAAGDEFGNSVAISGDYAIVGAMLEDHNTTGGQYLYSSGSAYIFKRNANDGSWKQSKKIVASDREEGDMFGSSVSISGDYAIVGAYNEDQDQTGGNTLNNSGSAYIFKNTAGTWAQVNKFVASDRGGFDEFGYSVAISGDYAIAGAYKESENATGGNTLTYSGSTYIFKNCVSRSIDVKTACNKLIWIDGNTYSENNNTATYNIVGGSMNGCDSIVTLDLTINKVSDLSISANGNTLSSNNSNATYQWLDCNKNYAAINGETGRTYIVNSSGNYAVKLTENTCVDTSECASINISTFIENSFKNALIISPNPFKENLSIDLGAHYENIIIVITDISGKLIESKTIEHSQVIDVSLNSPSGVYFVTIQTGDKKAELKLVKN